VPQQRALKLVEVIVGWLRNDFAVKLPQLVFALAHHGRLHKALLDLEIRFAIQLGRLDEAQTVWLARRQQQNVGGHKLIVLHSNDVADLN